MTESRLKELIKQGENVSTEFKSCTTELSSTTFETVCAFLNRSGGHLLLGVKDSGEIVGVKEQCIESMTKINKEIGHVEELGSGRKNIQKYAPLYYKDYKVEVDNEEKFIFSITYREGDDDVSTRQAPRKFKSLSRF